MSDNTISWADKEQKLHDQLAAATAEIARLTAALEAEKAETLRLHGYIAVKCRPLLRGETEAAILSARADEREACDTAIQATIDEFIKADFAGGWLYAIGKVRAAIRARSETGE